MFEKLFGKKKQTVTFHMKSGRSITFKCDTFKCNHDGAGELASYNAQGYKTKKGHDPLFWVSLPAVESVEIQK